MRKVMMTIAGMTALCLHSDVHTIHKEIRRVAHEYEEARLNPDTPDNQERVKQLRAQLDQLAYDRISALCERLRGNEDNPKVVNSIMAGINIFDGDYFCAPRSPGHPQALEWARKLMRDENIRLDWLNYYELRDFLMRKGDARDVELLPPSQNPQTAEILGLDWGDKLAMRVAGTNLFRVHGNKITQRQVNGINIVSGVSFIPSVTNTGPQAPYVFDTLLHYWDMMEDKSVTNIPPDLITMVVWFDGDGNPMCNVDLSKYGLTMPELDVPGKPTGKADPPVPPLEGERPREPETSNGIPAVESSGGLQPPEQTPPTAGNRRHLWLYAGIAVFILGIGGLYARSKISKS